MSTHPPLVRSQACTCGAASSAVAPKDRLLFGMPANTVAMLVMFLSAMDSLATVLYLRTGRGVEINPAMSWLQAHGGESLFVFAKIILTGVCMLWVVHRARHTHARIASVAAFAIYMPIVGVHIYNNAVLVGYLR